MSAENLSAPELWAKTVEQVKLRVNHRSLWESLEKTSGIAIEDGIFIVGMNSRYLNESGHMQTSEHRNAIETTLSNLAGQPLRIRIIEGETAADWEATKQRDARVAVMRSTTYQKKDKESSAAQSWDAVYDQVAKTWSSLTARQLPQIRSRYITEMTNVVAQALESMPLTESDEHSQRLIARVIDRIAGNVEVPSAMIALEIDKARARRVQ
jgi:hypothetical protein